jgi:hypothetical protein
MGLVSSAGAVTAEGYRQYAEAMGLVSSAGAVTADSYRQYAEAMELVPVLTR